MAPIPGQFPRAACRSVIESPSGTVTHAAGVSWNLDHYPWRGTATLEVDNFTDAKVFDNFGVQRPGRAYSLKVTGSM